MKEIIITAFVISLISIIARTILPKIQILVKLIIKICVKYSERKIKGSGLGKQKKEKVLKWLKIFNIKSCEFVDELIESAVDIMNSKQINIKSDIKNSVSSKVDLAIDNIIKKD
jgi:hypothetical protein